MQLVNQPKSIDIRSLTLKQLKEGDGNLPDLLREMTKVIGTTSKIDAAGCISNREFVITFYKQSTKKAWSKMQVGRTRPVSD